MDADLAALLTQAWMDGPVALPLELTPLDAASSYTVQDLTLLLRGQQAAGWKVGAKGADGPAQGAPLPQVLLSPARLQPARFGRFLGLELEIAFRIGREFPVRPQPYGLEEALAGVDGVCAAIELVASRLRPQGDNKPLAPLAQLADLQNHGALVAGACVPYDPAFPFVAPALSWQFDGRDIAPTLPANPAGDPRRLLVWVLNHCRERGQAVPPGTLITTGTYTGAYLPEGPGEALGQIAGLPPVRLVLV
ncbi:2-keto-4-pentenoate hydratase [Paucibacter sp. O1-1]|uniref:fumarylacetoacetate hydrolase family protein n=1 Tax=Paucibacter sp. M5-1 TaxID=3015998 RepID=UPI0021D4949C|nr:fumarylacetoacetate hydrolase family protein [Paucibacter sp. M5-1]MCU7369645.1 2-keto-4-pentenoate hydratase [Paucibacter sp. O1-1]MCZ7883672.1 2-keto-4-pentenoate hydratase [Paucibacter sp. M5-1]MDA3824629.1 2-keto-4-pentenoate hydratase [Paucibacter sp. O1-1]